MDFEWLPNGGLSFMLLPTAEKTYDFWVYICPDDIPFSSKQAVKSLTASVERGTVSWGQIVLNDQPLLDQLVKFLISEQSRLPSEVGKQALEITLSNLSAETLASNHKINKPDTSTYFDNH